APSPRWGEGEGAERPLSLAEVEARGIFAFDFLDDGLAADDLPGLRIVGQGRRAVELPAAIEGLGDAVTERSIVRAGQIPIKIHGIRPRWEGVHYISVKSQRAPRALAGLGCVPGAWPRRCRAPSGGPDPRTRSPRATASAPAAAARWW